MAEGWDLPPGELRPGEADDIPCGPGEADDIEVRFRRVGPGPVLDSRASVVLGGRAREWERERDREGGRNEFGGCEATWEERGDWEMCSNWECE